MGLAREQPRQLTVLERGSVSIFYRPRAEEQGPQERVDVERLLLVLEPADGYLHRVIAIGRKRLPRAAQRARFWGFVDLVLYDRRDLEATLAAQTYGAETRGPGHLPEARPAATGSYALVQHDDHAQLTYSLAQVWDEDPVVRDLALELSASYVVTVANPDPAAWGLREMPRLQSELFDPTEVHVTIPAPLPLSLQQRFRGRRFAELDTTRFLDHPGTELIFVAGPPTEH